MRLRKNDLVERLMQDYTLEEIKNFLHHNPYGFDYTNIELKFVQEDGDMYYRAQLPDGGIFEIGVNDMLVNHLGISRDLAPAMADRIYASIVHFGKKGDYAVLTADTSDSGERAHLMHILEVLIELAHLSDLDEIGTMILEANVLSNIMHGNSYDAPL